MANTASSEVVSVCKEKGGVGVWYMANTASSEVVSVCKERGVGWGCGTWPTLPVLR